MALPEITLVVGIDAKTIEQLAVSWPTWKKNRPQMWDWKWIVFIDRDVTGLHRRVAEFFGDSDRLFDPGDEQTQVVLWPFPGIDRSIYASQREAMLSGHVFVPAILCDTPYHFKLDTDAIARNVGEWPQPEWFQYAPAVIAPRWHYSKGKSWLGMLEDWGECSLPHYRPLGCRGWTGYSDEALRVGHARWCSWCSLYRTDFTREVAELCKKTLGDYKLPVPSQDTTMWYVAERMKQTVRIENMKRLGWSNHSRIDELRRVAAEIMADSGCQQPAPPR